MRHEEFSKRKGKEKMTLMDVKIGVLPTGPQRLRNGRFEKEFIAQFDQPIYGCRLIPLNGRLTKAGLFKIVESRGISLAMTAECVHYILGKKEEIGNLRRSQIADLIKTEELSSEERAFWANITHEITLIHLKIFCQEEKIREMEHISAGKEFFAQRIGAQIELPEPSDEHYEYLIERTANLLKGKIYLVNQVLKKLGFELG